MALDGELITVVEAAMMRRPTLAALLAGVALGAVAASALAESCYEVIDRNDAVIYRDTRSPVDLSEAGQRAREAMRARGELLVFFDTETCIVLGKTTPTGSRTLTVDEIVAEYKGFAGRN